MNALVTKTGGNVDHGAKVANVTAQGSTCTELTPENGSKRGVLIQNRDLSITLGVTLIANPPGLPNATVRTTAEAFAKRIQDILPGETAKVEAEPETRVLVSAGSGTPEFSWTEYGN